VVDEPSAPERLANLGGWRGAVVSNSWGLVLSAALGARLARATWPRILRGEVVISDRYVLDAGVELRYFYGDRPFRPHTALLKLLTPRPAGAFLLEIDPELAAERKGEFSGAQNVRRAALYAELAAAEGVVRVDGSRSRDEIASDLAGEVWGILGQFEQP
jgi:thymidylate kinase